MNFERIVIINLARRKDRWDKFQKDYLPSFPFKPVERFDAVDNQKVGCPKGFVSGGGAWGCRCSHVRVLEQALMDGVESVLVLEDDVCFKSSVDDEVGRFFTNVPDDWQALWLGGQHLQSPKQVKPGVVKAVNVQRTHAYAVRGDFIKTLYGLWASPFCNKHIDHHWGGSNQGQYRVYCPDPFIFGQDRSKSDISGALNPKKFWIAPSKDQPVILYTGQDIERARGFGCHTGWRRNPKTDIDLGLENVFKNYSNGLFKKWIDDILWEVGQEENLITTVWHPDCTIDHIKQAWDGRVIVANCVEDLMGLMPKTNRRILWNKEVVALVQTSREIKDKLTELHFGFWLDGPSGIDNGLRQLFHEKKYSKLREWWDCVSEETDDIPACYHPEATKELLQQYVPAKVLVINGHDVVECQNQINQFKDNYANT